VISLPDWILSFPKDIYINIKDPINSAIDYMLANWGVFFDGVRDVLRGLLNGVGSVVNLIPWWLLLALVFFATYRASRKWGRAALYTVLLFFIGSIGLWDLMNKTLTIVITSVIISLLIGLPIGVLISTSKKANAFVRPILDTMQTMPSFVYLIPAAMLLGIGDVPAIIATTIYAVPPVIRLTSHGIQQVNSEVVEAAKSFGATRMQSLFKVQIPQALPTIMTGVNQTIMMAISMVVTSSMIGATGLGSEVIRGINRLDSGIGFSAGIAIVIVAIIIDRLTQGVVRKRRTPNDE
jgi:ABC-type proline/glycine betaine transport system permease subunit